MKKNEKGFSLVEGFLILIIAGLLGSIGFYVWHSRNPASSTINKASNTQSAKASQPISPNDFIKEITAALDSNNEAQLEQYLSPSYKSFRQTSLTTEPCANRTVEPSGLFCGSVLGTVDLSEATPTITDITFKDGQKGKSVDYHINHNGEPGTDYFSFKLESNGSSWLLNDYTDFFVQTGDNPPNPIIGERGA